jgi:hypothetical protein
MPRWGRLGSQILHVHRPMGAKRSNLGCQNSTVHLHLQVLVESLHFQRVSLLTSEMEPTVCFLPRDCCKKRHFCGFESLACCGLHGALVGLISKRLRPS